MSDLESLVRQSLAREAGQAPSGAHLLDDVASRLGTRRTAWHGPVLAMAAVVILLAAVSFAALRSPHSSIITPATAPMSVVPASAVPTPLVSAGECAGLSLRIEQAEQDSGVPGALVSHIRPGADNAITVDGNHLLLLRVSGPCSDGVGYSIVEPDGADRVQGATGDAVESFNDDGVGLLVTHATTPGRARVDIVWVCTPTICRDGPPLASVTVDVVAPFLDGVTHEPTSLGTP